MMTTEQVRAALSRECEAAGGQKAWADAHNISQQYVCDVIGGSRQPGPTMRKALGLERVTLYKKSGTK